MCFFNQCSSTSSPYENNSSCNVNSEQFCVLFLSNHLKSEITKLFGERFTKILFRTMHYANVMKADNGLCCSLHSHPCIHFSCVLKTKRDQTSNLIRASAHRLFCHGNRYTEILVSQVIIEIFPSVPILLILW